MLGCRCTSLSLRKQLPRLCTITAVLKIRTSSFRNQSRSKSLFGNTSDMRRRSFTSDSCGCDAGTLQCSYPHTQFSICMPGCSVDILGHHSCFLLQLASDTTNPGYSACPAYALLTISINETTVLQTAVHCLRADTIRGSTACIYSLQLTIVNDLHVAMSEAISLLHSASMCSIGMPKHMCCKDTHTTHAAVNVYTLSSNCQRQEACSKQVEVACCSSQLRDERNITLQLQKFMPKCMMSTKIDREPATNIGSPTESIHIAGQTIQC